MISYNFNNYKAFFIKVIEANIHILKKKCNITYRNFISWSLKKDHDAVCLNTYNLEVLLII